MPTGQTVITINHPQRDVTLKKGYGFRGRNVSVLDAILNSVANGSKGVTADVQQNGGTGVKASGIVTAAAPVAADSVSVNGAALTAIQLHARGVVTFAALANADSVTVAGVVFTALTTVLDGGYVQFALGANDTAAAANAAALINAHPTTSPLVVASSVAGALKIRAFTTGTTGNTIPLISSNGTRAAVTGTSGGTLSGGAAPTGDQWDYGDTNAQSAKSIADCVNRSATVGIAGVVTATSSGAAATITAIPQGPIGNLVALVSSNGTRLPVTGVTAGKLSGGAVTAANAL